MGAHERFPALVTCVRCLKEVPMDDADRLLAPGGRLYLQLNAKPDVHPDLVYYDRPTRELFASRGDVESRYVLIAKP